MAGTDVEIVVALYRAFRERDAAAIAAAMGPDVVVRQTEQVPWGGEYVGPSGVQAFFAKLLAHIDSAIEVEAIFEAGDRVVQYGRSRGRVVATGREFDVPETHVWTLRAGKVVAVEFYVDVPAIRRALGA